MRLGYVVTAGKESPAEALHTFHTVDSLPTNLKDVKGYIEDAFKHTRAKSAAVYRLEFVRVATVDRPKKKKGPSDE